MRPNWPDPFLGLGRTFIYGLQDLDRGADALQQAERLGYTPGERETVQLADGYRLRGDSLSRNAKQLHGMPQERDHLERAAEAYKQALTLYLSVKDFSNVGPDMRLSQQSLNRVEKRLAELVGRRADEPTYTVASDRDRRYIHSGYLLLALTSIVSMLVVGLAFAGRFSIGLMQTRLH